jgi:hypothetical protein
MRRMAQGAGAGFYYELSACTSFLELQYVEVIRIVPHCSFAIGQTYHEHAAFVVCLDFVGTLGANGGRPHPAAANAI